MKHLLLFRPIKHTNKSKGTIFKNIKFFLYFLQWCWVDPQDAVLDRKSRFLKLNTKKHKYFILGLRSIYFMHFSDPSKKDVGI